MHRHPNISLKSISWKYYSLYAIFKAGNNIGCINKNYVGVGRVVPCEVFVDPCLCQCTCGSNLVHCLVQYVFLDTFAKQDALGQTLVHCCTRLLFTYTISILQIMKSVLVVWISVMYYISSMCLIHVTVPVDRHLPEQQ